MSWTRELRRAFVSSTYLDLRETRRLVAEQLVSAEILPIGMEIFPSSGEGQWEVIRTAIDSCNFYVLVVGGRYGSIAPESVVPGGKSWTQAEYEYAKSKGKPVVALLHGATEELPNARVDERSSRVWEFREALTREVLVRYFQDDTDLVSGLYTSLLHLRESEAWPELNQTRLTAKSQDLESFLRSTYDRRYEFVGASWSHQASVQDPDRWDATCRAARTVRPNLREGLSSFGYTLTKPSGEFDSLHLDSPPKLTLLEAERSEAGTVRIRDRARRFSPASYVHDFDFIPQLRRNELCTFRWQVDLPRYRYAYCDDVLAASQTAAAGPREYETTTVEISFPTDRLVLSAALPRSLGARILGFSVRRGAVTIDEEEIERLQRLDCFGVTEEQHGGEMVDVAALDVPNPLLKRTYEIRWKPPRRNS